ncbi:MAG TPA: alpha-2-macroglobulin family protein, partial [Candidatus Paceibacterota bacterium]|nr:alpha-2-macroglobulin family protein [Candidatus Paceibacterota bacterium]
RQTQGHLALGLNRWGGMENKKAAAAILASIKERSVSDEEMGRFWRDTEISWWWYRAPIETQALMIEAFAEIARDESAVEECQTWLLKQKQTQNWKTTKATADAIYALLLRGSNLLASDRLVQVSLGGLEITPRPGPSTPGQPPAVEPGTGYYEKRFSAPEIQPRLGEITVRKLDDGVAWGSIHWQYLEDAAKVAPYQGTPLQLAKTLFVRRNTARGPMLEPIRGPLAVGDELVVRLELRVDRDMEYVHLKDQRGSGIEPLAVLSGYRYQDGLAYYESTRDAASHFFIDYLPKGAYVFEYAARVFHRGRYQSGLAEIQCMYAPEFNSHSQSILIEVGQ